jgi:RecB family exonuclease
MHLQVGLLLDGQHGHANVNELDAITTGPLGLLNVLETQLGLLCQEASGADRVLQYRELLKRLDGPHRFYHQSFAVDELGTASTLLAWRDQWHLQGLIPGEVGQLAVSTSLRLRDMADLEVLTGGKLYPSIGERLALVEAALSHLSARIERLSIQEPLAWWPKAWQEVLLHLSPVALSNTGGSAAPSTLLSDLQQALLPDGTASCEVSHAITPIRWRDDGSVKVFQAETGWLAARCLTGFLANEPQDTLLCAPDIGVLDEVLVGARLPRQGFKEPSPLRPALQVLPLVIGQMWRPLNLYGLLQFLTHPICPVPRVARIRLSEMLARSPGIGHGPAWDKAMKQIEADCEKDGIDWADVRERIRLWVEHERHDPTSGAPLLTLDERLRMLSLYLQGRLKDPDPARQVAFNSGLSQTLTLQRALQALALQGETHIGAQSLQTLLSQATAQGGTNPMLVAQVGACRTITHPGAATEAVAQVVWWNMQAPGLLRAYPWSRAEVSDLQAAGVQLPDMSDLLTREGQHWLRPILAARERLVLVLPAQGIEVHPIWLQLESLFEKGHGPRIQSMEAALTDPTLLPVVHQPLPARRRRWSLPPDALIPKRNSESFSSLESFLFNPLLWVLRYPAALNPSSILDVSEGVLLYGNLSHHLVERYVQRSDALTLSEQAFEQWFEREFDALVSQEGAVLLMPGRQEELASLKRRLKVALRQLCLQWKTARVVSISSEEKLEGHFTGGAIQGYGDLLVTRDDGQQAIIDMKWGSKSYADKLATNRYLQLVLYGEIVRQRTGRWPHLAYFSLSSGELLSLDRSFFPQARVIRQKDDMAAEGPAYLWQRFLVSWQWRRQQLDQGQIEVVISNDEDIDAEDAPPENGLAPEVLNTSYNDYLTLAGWGEDQ